METEHATLDRLYVYPGTRTVWISFKTADGFLTTERGAKAVNSFAAARKAIEQVHGVRVVNSRYDDAANWDADVFSARLRGLKG